MLTVRRSATVAAVATVLALAGCGGSDSGPGEITVGAARTFRVEGFRPAGVIQPGRPTEVSFTIDEPSGETLTSYRRGAGPHTRVHLIAVSDDLREIVHRHPPIGRDGRIAETMTFPAAGRYRLVIDAFPNIPSGPRNFQFFRSIRVGEAGAKRRPPPPFSRSVAVDGYRFTLTPIPRLRAIEPASLDVRVVDPRGRAVRFAPYFGALAHAIFFRAGTLDYFHTHVCGPRTPGCNSTLGAVRVRGRSTAPGRLSVGVLLPLPGTWRLFLQARVEENVLTAPFTLKVR
jgi:hypothetical protein